MTLNINTTPEKYFHQLVEVFRIMDPFINLRKRQREVFAEILYYNHKLSAKDPEIANRVLNDAITKEEIAVKLGITKANLYNIYKELRQFGFLTKDGINPKYKYKYLHYPEITFRFQDKSSV